MEEVKTSGGFVLPNKIITVKHINRKTGMAANVSDDHVIAGGMLIGSVKKFQAPLLKNGSIANILTPEEKEYLEKVTDLNLSVYGDFWKTHFVSLYKEDNSFDLSNPIDYISSRILSFLKNDIAPSWEQRNDKLTYQFVVTSANEEMIEKKHSLDHKKEAFKIYSRIENDKEKLLGVLKLLSTNAVSRDTSLSWLQTRVEEHLDAKPLEFVTLMNDPTLETKLLINEAIEKGVILKKSNRFVTEDGMHLYEPGQNSTFENAVAYLDNNKNQDVRSFIEGLTLSKDKNANGRSK